MPFLSASIALLLWAVGEGAASRETDNGSVTEDIPYGKRISDALTGFIIGWILLIFSIILIYIVEKQAVRFDLILSRCRKATKVLPSADIDQNNEGRSVFFTGKTNIAPGSVPVDDRDTGFVYSGHRRPVRLRRQVQMFQWVEREEKEEKKKIYSYRKEWSETDHDSKHFKNPSGHHNPRREPHLYSETRDAARVCVGEFALPSDLILQMKAWVLCDISQANESGFTCNAQVERELKSHVDAEHINYANIMTATHNDVSDFLVYNGKLADPSVGTIKVSYEAIPEDGDVSVIGVQSGDSLRAFTELDANTMQPSCLRAITNAVSCAGSDDKYDVADFRDGSDNSSSGCFGGACCMCVSLAQALAGGVVGSEVLLIEERNTAPVQMFRDELGKFGKRLKIMRFVGCFGISLGIYLIFNPIAVLLSFIPYLSGLISNLFFVLALIIGFVLGAVEISLAWVFHRPQYLFVVLTALGGYFTAFDQASIGYCILGIAALPLILCLLHCVDERNYEKALAQKRQSDIPVANAVAVSYESFGQSSVKAVSGVDLEHGVTPTAPPMESIADFQSNNSDSEHHSKKKKKAKKAKTANLEGDSDKHSLLL